MVTGVSNKGVKQSTKIDIWDQSWDIMLSLTQAMVTSSNWIWKKAVGNQSCIIQPRRIMAWVDNLSGHMI